MWTEQQRALQTFHSQDLAWRLIPSNEEEMAIVMEHFPHADFRSKEGAVATLDFDRIHVADWPEPIFFKDISKASVEDAFRGKWLTIEHVVPGKAKSTKTKFYPAHYTGEKGDLLTLFGVYYGRHMNSRGATTA
jgi:hypothetical protein